MPQLSRREFVRSSGIALAGFAAVSACGTGTKNGPKTLDDIINGRTQRLSFIAVGTELLSGIQERVAFGLATAEGLFTQATGKLWLAKSRDVEAIGPIEIAFRGDGLPSDRGYYSTTVTLPEDGTYLCIVEAEKDGEILLAGGQIQVGRRNQMPIAGGKAINVATPTTDNKRGVDPICTQRPPCGMHEKSLDAALADGDKIIFTIATPAFCTSRLCGPEIEILDKLRPKHPDVTFIHAEVLANDDADTVKKFSPLSPAVAAWKLEEEPAIYAINSEGNIVVRELGPVDSADAANILSRLKA